MSLEFFCECRTLLFIMSTQLYLILHANGVIMVDPLEHLVSGKPPGRKGSGDGGND
jgi:hypothetical protein